MPCTASFLLQFFRKIQGLAYARGEDAQGRPQKNASQRAAEKLQYRPGASQDAHEAQADEGVLAVLLLFLLLLSFYQIRPQMQTTCTGAGNRIYYAGEKLLPAESL